jgi:hypothetical protein
MPARERGLRILPTAAARYGGEDDASEGDQASYAQKNEMPRCVGDGWSDLPVVAADPAGVVVHVPPVETRIDFPELPTPMSTDG